MTHDSTHCDECGRDILILAPDGERIDGAISLDGRLIGRCCMTDKEARELLPSYCPEGGYCGYPGGRGDCPGFQGCAWLKGSL